VAACSPPRPPIANLLPTIANALAQRSPYVYDIAAPIKRLTRGDKRQSVSPPLHTGRDAPARRRLSLQLRRGVTCYPRLFGVPPYLTTPTRACVAHYYSTAAHFGDDDKL